MAVDSPTALHQAGKTGCTGNGVLLSYDKYGLFVKRINQQIVKK